MNIKVLISEKEIQNRIKEIAKQIDVSITETLSLVLSDLT